MTIKLPTKAEQEALEEAIRNPEGNAYFFELSTDDLELGTLIREGDWGSEGGGIYVDFTLAQPLDIEDAPSSFAVSVNGVAVPQMAGITSFPEIKESVATEFLAVSSRAEANRASLNQITRFPGVPPDEVVREAARLLPYSQRYTRIDPLKEPLLYYQEPDAHFLPNETVGDILKRVEDQTSYKIRDNAWGGLTASLVAEAAQVKDYRNFNATDFGSNAGRAGSGRWRKPPRTERRYSEVVVFRRHPDGTDAFEPQRARIDYRGMRPALPNAALWIELDDTTEQAPMHARNRANEMARKLARGIYADTGVILPFFDPLIEIQDVFIVFERWEDYTGIYHKKWMCWVESYKHDFMTLATEVSYSAALIEKDKLEIPALPMAGVSGGVMRTVLGPCEVIGGIAHATVRLLPTGELVPSGVLVPQTQDEVLGDRIRLDISELDWVEENGDLITVGEDAPTVEVNGDLVSITCGGTYTPPFFGEVFPNLIRFDGVSWATESGNLVVIDPASSSGHAVVSGDLITIS